MKEPELPFQKKLLSALAGKIDDFYLVGGTALSMVYFQHRASYDLDLFTKSFSRERINRIMADLQKDLDIQLEIIREQTKDRLVKIVVYLIHFKDGSVCKIDFVEDHVELLNPLRTVDDIKVLSLQDIYLRKIFAAAGHIVTQDMIGRDLMVGGRQEEKDFYDLYCLSSISQPLSKFASQYCHPTVREGLINWYRTYDRMTIKTGLLDLKTTRKIDYRIIDDHFKEEIDKLLLEQIDFE